MKNVITKILLLVMVMSVSVFFTGCNKGDKAENQNNNEQSNNSISSVLNQNKGNNLPQSYTQNNFTITIERIELVGNGTLIFFKVMNKNDFSISFFSQSNIVQGTKQYSSVRANLQNPTMPNVENDGMLSFPILENREMITLYFTGKPNSSSLPNAKWEEIKFEINLSGDGIIDKVAEEEAKRQAAEEAEEEKERIEKEERIKLEKETREGYSEELKQYMNHLHPCSFKAEDSKTENSTNTTKDGYQFYLKPIFLLNGKELSFSIGYIDDSNRWNEIKKFVSGKVDLIKNDNSEYYAYSGCFNCNTTSFENFYKNSITTTKYSPSKISFDSNGASHCNTHHPKYSFCAKLYVEDTDGPSITSISK